MQKFSRGSHLIVIKMTSVLGKLQLDTAIAFPNYKVRQTRMIFLVLPFVSLLDQGRTNRKVQDA